MTDRFVAAAFQRFHLARFIKRCLQRTGLCAGFALAVLSLAASSVAAEHTGRRQEALAGGRVYTDCAADERKLVQGWDGEVLQTAVGPRPDTAGHRPDAALAFVSHAADPSPLERNRSRWLELAETGNPFQILLNRQFEPELAPFQAPAEVTNAWNYRSMADRLAAIAFVAAEGQTPLRGRKDLVAHAVAKMDWMLDQVSPEGWWWRQGPQVGDPNVNRFTLGPLLDAVRSLRRLAEGQAAWSRWRGPLERAIDLQRRAYRGEHPLDWGGPAAGIYAKNDL